MRSRTAANLSPGTLCHAAHVRRPPLRQLVLLVVGCLVLGTGVAMLLTADLGSDGFSTLVNGTAIRNGLPFFVANLVISLAFLLLAAARRLLPGVGTVVQIVLVAWSSTGCS